MQILSHRYLTIGKSKEKENTLTQLKAALALGYNFFETDIRLLPSGDFYISHDPQASLTAENDAKEHVKLWKSSGAKIALNIKELGYEEKLVSFLKANGVVENCFLFDFDIEFLGAQPNAYIEKISALEASLMCAVRVSDHNETVDRAIKISNSKIIWLDEFDSLWVKREDVIRLKDAGKIIYCIAPDLHNFTHEQTMQRFEDFISWEVDGICTDYAEDLKTLIQGI
ncbi:MAG: hypothetical protein JNN11_04365 [Candidatus Doudnabacteria bacterium]|nr:hypothetical protein [Candidatus Doudnabacteria bacterium]